MTFVLRMAWRETRASWLRLSFFFLCVALGVASIVVLRSVVQDVRGALNGQARALLGADIVVQSPRPFTPELQQELDRILGAAGAHATSHVIETRTMAAAGGSSDGGGGGVKLVELRGVESAFPFYGVMELDGGVPYSHALVANHGAIVQPELLVALGLHAGDVLRLAGQIFTIRGVISRDRVQRSGIALGPRVYIDLADLQTTSLLGFGGRASFRWLIRVDRSREAEGLAERLKAALASQVATVRSWETLDDQIGDNLRVAENYLSLVGFVIVVLGGIGVWSVTRVVVEQKIQSIAILKCLGASSAQVFGTYLLQISGLALGGGMLGVVAAAGVLAGIPASILAPLGITEAHITASAAVQGAVVGLLVALLFALIPLLNVRDVKPLLLLRPGAASLSRKPTVRTWVAAVVIGVGLALVAMWQADSVRAGAYVAVGLGCAALGLDLVSRLLVRLVSPLARSSRFAVRHAVISLVRPGNQTRVILMVVGLGAFFVLGVRAVEANLLGEFARQIGGDSPDLVLIDIQQDQIESLRSVIVPYLREPPSIVPLLRARVVGVAGRRLQLKSPDDVRRDGRLTREFGLTFRDALEANERVDVGRFWKGPLGSAETVDGADTEVSVWKDLHDSAGIDLGDVIRFDVGGQPLRARVTSVRTVAWRNFQNGGFVFVLRPSPAVLRTPHNFIGFLQVIDDPKARGAVQRDLVKSHPNVSAIDVRDVLAEARTVIDAMTTSITIIGVVTLAAGALILVGAIAMTKFQRLYVTAVYRTLGASTRRIAGMTAVEYGVLGLVAGALAAVGALVLSWVLARRLFDIAWQPAPGLLAGGVAVVATAVTVAGLVANLDVLFRKPLATLRNE